ncbi:MAG: DUF481 domain-containing protein [Gemmatimonadales bacterium]|jgi:hypothetical protein
MHITARRTLTLATLLALVALAAPRSNLLAQEERTPGWYDQAEFSLVLTAGNTQSNTFGVKNKLERLFPAARLALDVGGLRVESGTTDRTAIGSPTDFEVVETTDTETKAENYFASLRYDRDLTARSYLYGSGGWVRNRFAGIDDRWTGAAGLGWKLIETDRTAFQADLGATVTSERPVVGETDSFAGLRFTWDLSHALTQTTKFTSALVVDENLSDTEDLRADFDNAVAVDISDALALKTGVKLLFDNQPALEEVTLLSAPGGPATGTVSVPLDKLDTQFTVALIVRMD